MFLFYNCVQNRAAGLRIEYLFLTDEDQRAPLASLSARGQSRTLADKLKHHLLAGLFRETDKALCP